MLQSVISHSRALQWESMYAPRAKRLTGSEIRELLKVLDEPGTISFAGGLPDPQLFPIDELKIAFDAVLSEPKLSGRALQYSASEGHGPLRAWISRDLDIGNGEIGADNILITNGAQQAIDYVGKLFVGSGDVVVVDKPTYLGAVQALNAYEPRFISANLANESALTEILSRRPKLVYVIPDFANPNGKTLTKNQREVLVAVAARYGVMIVEDTAYTKLRYEGATIPSLAAIASSHFGGYERANVIQVSTFSKTLAPGLRVGWLLAPRAVVDRLVLIKQATDLHCCTINQMVLATIADAVSAPQYLLRVRQKYKERRDAMLVALQKFFPTGSRWTKPRGGLYIWVKLPGQIDTRDLLAYSLKNVGVAFVPGGAFFVHKPDHATLRLSFSLADPAVIETGISRLGAAISRAQRSCSPSSCIQSGTAAASTTSSVL